VLGLWAAIAVGNILLPTYGLVGLDGFPTRGAVFATMPLVLMLTGFPDSRELGQLRALIARARSLYRSAAPS
jgi:hypothetical protein